MYNYYKISISNIAIAMKKLIISTILMSFISLASNVHAQPFGKGKYNENVPYGSETSITISTDGNVAIPVSPSDAGTLGTDSSVVTVTSTDVVGYKLYIRAAGASTNMTNGPDSLPTSGNGSPAALAVNTWGYNTDGSNNFVGISLSDTLIKNTTGPFSTGDNTTFTYGVKIDNSKPAGNYSTTILYTAAPKTD